MQRAENAAEQLIDAVEGNEVGRVLTLFADGVVFGSPFVDRPSRGLAALEPIVRAASTVATDFQWGRGYRGLDGLDHALTFHARIGDHAVEGCDFLHINEHGLIDEIYTMLRPLSGAIVFSETVNEQLAVETSDNGA